VAYNNVTNRADAQALMPEEVFNDFLGKMVDQSAALTLFRRIPVNRAQTRVPVLSALPVAYWVTGDSGLKQTTELAWANKYLNIEEIAVILPVPNNVAEDVEFDIWNEASPLMAEAVGRTFDAAIFFGTSAPASFPSDINTAAAAAGNTNIVGNAAAAGGFFGDFDETLALLEADGFDMGAVVARTSTKANFRAARSTQGERLDQTRIAPNLQEIDGVPIVYTMRNLWPATVGQVLIDPTQFVVGVRRDVTYEVFREGVVQDGTGAIVYNLMQQDMSAMRVTFRAGWQVGNVINNEQPTEANRYPAAVLRLS